MQHIGWISLVTSIGCEVLGTTFLKLASNGGKYAGGYSIGAAVS